MVETRIQKYLSEAGVMSRRSAEDAIKRGEIKINGRLAEIGQKVIPDEDKIEYKGKEISATKNKLVYVMLNKPVGYVTTLDDNKGRPCVADLVKDVGTRIYPVGRLDLESEGLLLLTNDGELTNRLTHPRHGIAKYYNVTVVGQVSMQTRKKLSSSMDIDGYIIQPVRHTVIEMKDDKTVLSMELFEGRNRQIRKMCEQCDLKVIKLRRVAIGNIQLGNLKPGSWRHLSRAQVDYLMLSCGLTKGRNRNERGKNTDA